MVKLNMNNCVYIISKFGLYWVGVKLQHFGVTKKVILKPSAWCLHGMHPGQYAAYIHDSVAKTVVHN